MQLGFVSAILADLSLVEVLDTAQASGYDTVELLCWPPGRAERRYAGVTHIDVTNVDASEARRINDLVRARNLTISGLGYYPNPLAPDRAEAAVYIEHIRAAIRAARLIGVPVVNSFIGRDWNLSVDANWPRFRETWPDLIRFASDEGIKIGIENCPMFFSGDEWPGGKNLAYAPAIWRRMFEEIPDPHFGLNYDPSHLVWLQIDYLAPIREFVSRFHHVHAKDVRVDRHRLNDVGIMGTPLQFHTPKLPGLGDIHWGQFFSVLTDAGYDGPVCVEVEDRAYEGSLAARKASLVQSARYLRNFMP